MEKIEGFPGFDYVTVIGRDPELFRWNVDNILRNSGLDRSQWAFRTIVYRDRNTPAAVTGKLLQICADNQIAPHVIEENPDVPFIYRLYHCWNLTQQLGTLPLTIRGGSDQAFSPGSFYNAAMAWMTEYSAMRPHQAVFHFQTMESEYGRQCNSRHICEDFGSSHETFNEKAFVDFAAKISRPGLFTAKAALQEWGKPGPFNSSLGAGHLRGDGCSWLISKELFKRFGPMQPMRGGYTGDVTFMDDLERNGIPSYIIGNAITYHLGRGESKHEYQ